MTEGLFIIIHIAAKICDWDVNILEIKITGNYLKTDFRTFTIYVYTLKKGEKTGDRPGVY